MSYHIVHVFNHGSRLTKERGMMVCKNEEGEENHELPIEDIRAVIIAARGIFMSQELVAALLEVNAVILHCDRSYRPVGITSGIERVVHNDALFNQGNRALKLHDRLWRLIAAAKVANQAHVLENYGIHAAFLKRQLEGRTVNEAACARHYWKNYFAILGAHGVRRHGDDEAGFNARLNYGYAVLGALIHRGIVAHGLSPVFGLHHITRYKAHALVYDLMEPWRPYIDLMLVEYVTAHPVEDEMRAWAQYAAHGIRDIVVETPSQKLKLPDAVDVFVSGIAKCYADKTVRHAWMPAL